MMCWAGWIIAGLLGATVVLLVWCLSQVKLWR